MHLTSIGPKKNDSGYTFTVWAPFQENVHLVLEDPLSEEVPMKKTERGYWSASLQEVSPGQLYRYRLGENMLRADPASHFQPKDVHGPSALVDHSAFQWTDGDFVPLPMEQLLIYELHIGTFTSKGTFLSFLEKLSYLKELGINTIEIMPVAQFPGDRNWGYDGTCPFAVQASYGGPQGLKTLVNACHAENMNVILDVVYNHLGPEGNYLRDFGPYFTGRYHTPWGDAVNFDGPHSDEVQNFFIQNMLHWFEHYHMDGLRLDATHAILDQRPKHFLTSLSEAAQGYGRKKGKKQLLIAESNLNDPRLATDKNHGGNGMDSVWSDDFHHGVHSLLTGETKGYYRDYGDISHLARAVDHGFAYRGEYSSFRQRSHGDCADHLPGEAFVISIQTHDQVGNRRMGDRLTPLTSFAAHKVAASLMILSPYVPMLFMGEEYGEDNPFLYFISHTDPDLVEAVRRGRAEEFKDFQWQEEPPDPQSPQTFKRSKLDWAKTHKPGHKGLLNLYKTLLHLRMRHPALQSLDRSRSSLATYLQAGVLLLSRTHSTDHRMLALFNFSDAAREITIHPEFSLDDLSRIVDSNEKQFDGPGDVMPETLAPMTVVPPFCASVYSTQGLTS